MPNLTISGSPTFNPPGPFGKTCTIDANGADRVRAPSSLLNATQGWIAIEFEVAFNRADSDVGIFAWQSGNAGITLAWRGALPGWDARRETSAAELQLLVANGAPHGMTALENAMPGVDNRRFYFGLTFAWTATQLKLAQYPLLVPQFQTHANTEIPDLSAATLFDIGYEAGGNKRINSPVHWFACGTGTLADADVWPLHAAFHGGVGGNGLIQEAPAPSSLPGSCTMVWSAESAAYVVP